MCGCLADSAIVKKADDILFNADPAKRKRCLIVIASPGFPRQNAISKIVSEAGYEEASFAKAFPSSQARNIEEEMLKESTVVSKAFKFVIFNIKEMKVVIGGFPRTEPQLDAWNKDLAGGSTIKGVVYIELPEDVQKQKLKDLGYMTDEINSMVENFKTKSLPLIEKFKGEGLLISLDGTKPEADLYKEMIDQIIVKKLHL